MIGPDPHLRLKQRMVVGILGIIHTHDPGTDQIQQQPCVLAKLFLEHFDQAKRIHGFLDHQKGSDLQAAASISRFPGIFPVFFREILHVVVVGIHPCGILLQDLSDDDIFRDAAVFFLYILLIVCV